MREVIPFSEVAFYANFERQLRTRCVAFTDIALNKREFVESIKPFIQSADMMFVAHFIGEETYARCRGLYDEVCKTSMKALEEKENRKASETGDCTLRECPVGLFYSEDGTLCLKTEYGLEAYIVASGERFWGGVDYEEELGEVRVTPCQEMIADRLSRRE